MDSWFPIAKGLINDESFRTLTPAEKIYFCQVLSDYNLNGGQYYKADIWYAAALNLSIDKIRKARAKLAKMGYIDMIPGTQDKRGKKLATTYKGVKWHNVPEGEQFSKMHRPTFEKLVDNIRDGVFKHEDVACYVYISHLVYIRGGDYAVMTKGEFCDITNMPKALVGVKNLLKKFKFDDGDKLFKFTDSYHTIKLMDVEKVESTQVRIDQRYKEIEKRIKSMRDKEDAKLKVKARQKGDIFVEDLLPLFNKNYIEHLGKKPVVDSYDEHKLSTLGDPVRVAEAIKRYFDSELPKPSGLKIKNYTLYNFNKYAEYYMK